MDYQIPCHKDVELMRLFIWIGYITAELNMLNRCRLYMRVVFLFDICNAAGTNLESYNETNQI